MSPRHQRRPREIQGTLFDTQPAPAFVPPRRTPTAAGDLRGMVRHPDRETSIAAAESAQTQREKLKSQIFAVLQRHGPMNDGELSKIFHQHPVSSIAKRRGDLCDENPPRVVATDTKRGHPDRPRSLMTVWRAV